MLAPDAAVPHRDALLDERLVASLLSGRLHAGTVGSCRCEYAKYRVGESLRVVYRRRRPPRRGAGFAPGAGEAAYGRALATAVPAPPLRAVVHVPELDAVFWAFPNDRRLTTLPLLAGRSPLARPAGRRPRDAAARRLRCRAFGERRVPRRGRAACSPTRRSTPATARSASGAASRRAGGRRRPARAARDRRLGARRGAGARAVAGRRLDTLPARELAGRARAARQRRSPTLHERSRPPSAGSRRLDAERLASAVGVIARARPDAGRAGGAAARRACSSAATTPPARRSACTATRTCATRSLDGERVALIDLEDAAGGPGGGRPRAGARTAAAARVRPDRGRRRARARDALLDGYAAVRPPPGRAGAALAHRRRRCSRASRCPPSTASAPPVLRRLGRCCEPRRLPMSRRRRCSSTASTRSASAT